MVYWGGPCSVNLRDPAGSEGWRRAGEEEVKVGATKRWPGEGVECAKERGESIPVQKTMGAEEWSWVTIECSWDWEETDQSRKEGMHLKAKG